LAEWQAYDSLDPIGEWRADFRIASLQAFIQNAIKPFYKNTNSKQAVPLDFMPDWSDEIHRDSEQMSVEQIKSALMGIAKVQNKKVANQKKPPPKK
jgi:hypothetical protein